MYFVENNVIYSIDDIVYKNVIISKEDIDDIENNEIIKYREVLTINNYNENDYIKLDLSIFDLSNIDNYLRLLAMLKINDYKLYEDVKNLLLISNDNNDTNKIILESTTNDFYMSVMNRLVIFLYKYNINGYYLSKTYNRRLSIIESHINFIL